LKKVTDNGEVCDKQTGEDDDQAGEDYIEGDRRVFFVLFEKIPHLFHPFMLKKV